MKGDTGPCFRDRCPGGRPQRPLSVSPADIFISGTQRPVARTQIQRSGDGSPVRRAAGEEVDLNLRLQSCWSHWKAGSSVQNSKKPFQIKCFQRRKTRQAPNLDTVPLARSQPHADCWQLMAEQRQMCVLTHTSDMARQLCAI